MRSPVARLRRGPMRWVALAGCLCLLYAGGVATGALVRGGHESASRPQTRSSASGTVTDLDAVRDRLSQQAVRAVSRGDLDRAAVQGMLASLHDPWSAFFDRDDYAAYQATLNGHYIGVGLRLSQRADNAVVVAGVQAGSPAAAAHVPVGAQITAVSGHSVTGESASRVAIALRGQRNSSVEVDYTDSSGSHALHLTREEVVSDDVAVDWLTPQVARITIAAFTRGVGREVRNAMTTLRGEHAGGVVLDLRGNPGGLLDEAVQAASAFLDGGPVVSYERRGAKAQVLDATPGGDTTTPLAVIVDGATASAAEVLAGALQDRHRAVVVGSRTFGKGTVQQPLRLSDGSVVEITVATYRTPSGRSLDGVGLEPDIEVSPGAPAGSAQQRAVEAITGLLADAGTGGRG